MSTSAGSIRVDVPGFDAAEIAREAVAVALAEAMVGKEDAVKKIVLAAMVEKVDGRGVVSQYHHDNKISFMEWLCHDLIRKATIDVMKAKVETLRPFIEKQVEKELRQSANATAKLVADQFLKQANNSYGVEINVSIRAKS